MQGRLIWKRKDSILLIQKWYKTWMQRGSKHNKRRRHQVFQQYTQVAHYNVAELWVGKKKTHEIGLSSWGRGHKRGIVIEEAMVLVEYEPIMSSQIAKKKRTRITKKGAKMFTELVNVPELTSSIPFLFSSTEINTLFDA